MPAQDAADRTPTGQELLAVAIEAAEAAAAELLPRSRRLDRLDVRSKSTATDPVSEADEAAEAAIVGVLRARVPEDGRLGEEGADHVGESGRRWIVDPLDGTVNFLHGVPQWCVSVACEGLVGVVLDPLRGERFTVVAGEPTLLDGDELPRREAAQGGLGRALVGTGFGYDADVRARQGEVVARVLPRVRDVRRAGAAALDLAWTAAGRLDAFYEHGVKAWDVAAGRLLCEGVGLDVHELPGDEVRAPGLLAATPDLADELRRLVA